jgi:predicted AAA+ superfamily ATPase
MIPRHAALRLLRLLQGFPVVTVTGPRQSGKTTLVRQLLPDRPYVSLESPASREFARSRPAEFLHQYPDGAVIDEAQHAPELFSEMQSVVDAAGRMGLFVLTGSQNLSLLSRITQSLAGRTALVELMPLSIAELRGAGQLPQDYASLLTKGFFPAVYARDLDPYEWLQAYLVTYAERDARQLAAVQDLGAFQRFLRLVAARTGQLLNMQSLASDVGISDKTVKHWLSILETCYLIHYVRPHFANFGKRLVKMPKLYMTDVGLAAALIGIQNESQMQAHPMRGPLFETLVVNEFLKNRANAGLRDPLSETCASGVRTRQSGASSRPCTQGWFMAAASASHARTWTCCPGWRCRGDTPEMHNPNLYSFGVRLRICKEFRPYSPLRAVVSW